MESISAVIITHNEEVNLPNCFASLQGFVDEIIVVDSFSTDYTPELCKQQGVRFYQKAWTGYSDAKNFGNSLATNTFIFSIDADEVVSEALKNSILREKEAPSAEVYSMNRLTNYCGQWIRHGGWYPDRKIRLWKRESVVWEGHVHERPVSHPAASKGHLKGDLLHYSIPSEEVHLRQIRKYSGIWAEEAFRKGKKTNVLLLFLKPATRFLSMYLLKTGFLDGPAGFTIARRSAYGMFLRHSALLNLSRSR